MDNVCLAMYNDTNALIKTKRLVRRKNNTAFPVVDTMVDSIHNRFTIRFYN